MEEEMRRSPKGWRSSKVTLNKYIFPKIKVRLYVSLYHHEHIHSVTAAPASPWCAYSAMFLVF